MTTTISTTDWMALSACRTEPDLWFSEPSRRLAIHICRTHCPVRDQCAAEAERMPCAHGVQAGVAYDRYGEPMEQQPRPSNRACPTCASVRLETIVTRKPPTRWDDCGTSAAYRRHRRHEEQPCEPCTAANRQQERDRKARQSARREAA